MYNIVYITDDNYILPTKTSINSIVENIADAEICVNVIAVDVSEKNQNALKNLAGKNIKVNLLNFENEFTGLGLDHIYVSKAALFKFQIPSIFSDLDKILYVDGDMILSASAIHIFDFDISDKYAAVVADMLAMKFEGWHEKIGHEKYFNSGMMYLNLKKMRDDGVPEKLIEYKRHDTDGHFMDQNALNAILGNNVIYVSPVFNLMATCNPLAIQGIYGADCSEQQIAEFYGLSEPELRNVLAHPAILHVTSGTKAWKDITAEKIDEWLPFVKPEDSLKVAKNWCNSLSGDLTKRLDAGIAAVSGRPASPYSFGEDMLAATTAGVLIEGFFPIESWGRWAEANCKIRIFCVDFLHAPGDIYLSFCCYAFHTARNVQVRINGQDIFGFRAETSGHDLRIKVPAELLQRDSLLEFISEEPVFSPKSAVLGDDDRNLFLAFSYLKFDEDYTARLNELYGLIINTRHRTLYGACAWLFHKIFKRK